MTGETYHVFNRGAHKENIYTCDDDYRRFQIGLHLANHSQPVALRGVIGTKKYREPFSGYPADKTLVDVLGYSLMPNHFHLILRQKLDNGITLFLRKLSVGYSMYFNLKYGHSGTLFQGPFKSNHIDSEPYFQWIFAYVHLNAVALAEPKWEEKRVENPAQAWEYLKGYEHSSFYDFYSATRPERAILAYQEALNYIDTKQDLAGLLSDYSRGRILFES